MSIKFSKMFKLPRVIAALFLFAVFFLIGGTLKPINAQNKELSLADILIALRSKKAEIEEKNRLLAEAVKNRGVTFSLTPEIEKELGSTGAYPTLIAAIRSKVAPEKPALAMQKPVETKVDIAKPQPTPAPLDFAFYRTRASARINSGELDSAVGDLGKAIELKPTDARTIYDRGVIYSRQNKPDEALADVKRAIELDPKFSPAYMMRGQLLEGRGDTDLALVDYEKVTELDPGNESAKAAAAKIREARALAVKKAEAAKPPVQEPPAELKMVGVGALNEYATNLVKPLYTPTERKMGFHGKVTVQITLDEDGKIVAVEATEGPIALRRISEEAARKSKFKPVTANGKPVKAFGFIAYNFVLTQ